MANIPISALPNVQPSGYTNDDLLVIVNYNDSPFTGVTKNTPLTGLTSYVLSGLTFPTNFLPLSGGTVTGDTNFTVGLTATTISATTYYNLPIDIYVTGGTYDMSGSTIIFTNNTGGTFPVTGISTNFGNKWYIQSGETITIYPDYQYFIYGDIIVEGTLNILPDSQLVVLNGNIISSGGTLINDGMIYNIEIPLYDTKIDNVSFSSSTLIINQSDGSSFSVTIPSFTGGSGDCIANLYVTNIHGCSPITIHDQTQFKDSIASGILSFAEGSGTTAIGHYSHSEGEKTISGWKGFKGTFFGEGEYRLDSSYGNVTSEFTVGSYLVADGYTVMFDPLNYPNLTKIQIGLVVFNPPYTSLYTTPYGNFEYVADVNNLNSEYADYYFGESSHSEGGFSTNPFYIGTEFNQLKALGKYSHSEGLGTISLGVGSHSEGGSVVDETNILHTIAYGDYSHAEGESTTSLNTGSHSEGKLTVAGQGISGFYSHAEGLKTTTFGNYSHAEGGPFDLSFPYRVTKTIGDFSHAEGVGTTSKGNGSHSEGNLTLSDGNYSHSEGSGTTSLGHYSHSEGKLTKTGKYGAYLGNSLINGIITLNSGYGNVTSKFYSGATLIIVDNAYDTKSTFFKVSSSTFVSPNTKIDIGFSYITYSSNVTVGLASDTDDFYWAGAETIKGNYSHSEGYNSYSIGDYSHSEGYNTYSIGFGSHSEGGPLISDTEDTTLSIGDYSHAEGIGTVSYGYGSHSEGSTTESFGDYSHSEGYDTKSIGNGSHSEGFGTIAFANYQHVSGKYNVTATTEGAFIIGNGIGDSNRSNLLFAGNNEVNISGKTITTNFQMTSGASTSGYVLVNSDGNGNAQWQSVSGITGIVNKYTATTTFTASVTQTITHNLNTKFVHCSVWDSSNNQLVTAQVVRNSSDINNAVDITIATGGNYDILITG